MLEQNSDHNIRNLFSALTQALQSGDIAAFRALAQGPDPFQEELFLRQSLRVRDHALHVALHSIQREDDMAVVFYGLLAADGTVVDNVTVTLVRESLGWFVEEM